MNRKNEELIISLSGQWSMYLQGGYTLAEAIEYSGRTEMPDQAQNCLNNMLIDLEEGLGAEEAINRCRRIFPRFYINMFQLAVERGKLHEIMLMLRDYYKDRRKYRQELEKKLYYPLITLAVFVVLCLLSTNLFLPGLISVYTQMDLELPRLTRIFLRITDYIFHPALPVSGAILLSFLLFYRRGFQPPPAVDNFLLTKLPLFRGYFLHRGLRRFFVALHISLQAGGEIMVSLEQAVIISGSSYLHQRNEEVIRDLESGRSLMESLSHWLLIPDNLKPLLIGGEMSGNTLEAISFCAEYCQNQEKEILDKISINLEPAVILLLGGMAALIALALLLPLWDLYGGLSQI